MKFYKQCTMTSGSMQTTAWIPERGARVGKVINLKKSDDPKREWTVVAVSTARISQTEAQEQARASENFVTPINRMRGNK